MEKDSLKQGWLSVYRKIYKHWLSPFNRRGRARQFTKFEAWLYILSEVNHAPKNVLLRGKLYECKRGESVKSLQTWSQEFHWSKSKLKAFFKLLELDGMLKLNSDSITTHLVVCNYDSYQDAQHTHEPPNVPQKNLKPETKEPPKNLNNNGNNLITNNNIIKENILNNSEIFFNELQTINKLPVEDIKKKFRQFFNLEYSERIEAFNSSDVKRHFNYWLPKNKNKKAPSNKKDNNKSIPSNRP